MNPQQPYQQPGQNPAQPQVPPTSPYNGPYSAPAQLPNPGYAQPPVPQGQAYPPNPQQYQPQGQWPQQSAPAPPTGYPPFAPAPTPASPPTNPPVNPYDFITSPGAPVKHSPFSFSGSNSLKHLLVVAIGGGIVILLIIVASAVFSGGESSATQLIDLAAKQQEISRVAANGDQATSATLKNSSIALQLSLATDEKATVAYLQSHGVKVKPKQLLVAKDAKVDQSLQDAQSNSTFDQVLTASLQKDLQDYQASLQSTYKQVKSPAAKQLVQNEFNHANLLSEQFNQVRP